MTLEVLSDVEDYKQCAMRALLEMFADSKNVSRSSVGLEVAVVEREGYEVVVFEPYVIQ
jgi:hypothetical protein